MKGVTSVLFAMALLVGWSGCYSKRESYGYVYSSGERFGEGHCLDGERVGLSISWYKSGQKCQEVMWNYGALLYVNVWKPDGEKCPDTHLVDGDGVRVTYHENGQKAREENYLDGQLDGLSTIWRDNGEKWMEGHWSKGKKFGLWTSWHENGRKQSEGHYKDDRPEGEWISYPEEGTERKRVTFKDGAVVGSTQ
jgi:antitoxin component YwqK of YwqJK toxin-antitoxin module